MVCKYLAGIGNKEFCLALYGKSLVIREHELGSPEFNPYLNFHEPGLSSRQIGEGWVKM